MPSRYTITLILVLLGSLAFTPARATPDAPTTPEAPLTAIPSQVAVNLAQGEQRTTALTFANVSDTRERLWLYEAWAPDADQSPALLAAGPVRVPLPRQATRLDPELADALRPTPDAQTDFLVFLPNQADLSAALTIRDWAARGQYVYQTLAAQAEHSQAAVRQWLDARGIRYQSLWIANALLVRGNLALAQRLAERDDVALVRANRAMRLPTESAASSFDMQCSPDQPTNPICWNIRQIGADRVWRDFGVMGQGVVVANIDTGVRYDHPALVAQYRGTQADGSFNHDYNWFDPQRRLPVPQDDESHGTHTMGTIVAAGSDTLPAVGVAPEARWIAAQGCDNGVCTEADLISTAQWLLAPTRLDGAAPRPDLRPMIVNNSWIGVGSNDWYAGYVAAWRAAGIFPVFAAGNTFSASTQVCSSLGSPADYADVIAVGATDQQDVITSFSTFGPSAAGQIKPDVVAPGTQILSTAAGPDYRTLQGTSMAAPHVAGTVALLWSANPLLIGDYDATTALLRASAQPEGDARCGGLPRGPNNVYGYGRIDAYAAVARVRVDVPWLAATTDNTLLLPGEQQTVAITVDARKISGPGTYRARLLAFTSDLTQPPAAVEIVVRVAPAARSATVGGRVVDAVSSTPLHATVTADGGLRVATDASGVYTLTLTIGTHTLTASAPAYATTSQPVTINAPGALPDIALQRQQPQLALARLPPPTLEFGQAQTITLPISNTGALPLHYQIDMPPDRLALWRSDEPYGPAHTWIALPPAAPTVSLDDASAPVPLGIAFPFFGAIYTQTLIASDGALVFGPLASRYQPGHGCLPDDSTSIPFIAPLRTPLDTATDRHVRYGVVGATFVVSYEDVALRDADGAPATFQALLDPDGRIRIGYQRLPDVLPAAASVGVQQSQFESVMAGCGATLPVADGLTLEFRPQPAPQVWLSNVTPSGTLPPGSTQIISATARWYPPMGMQPLRATLTIASNDPFRPLVGMPIDISMRAAPHVTWLPIIAVTAAPQASTRRPTGALDAQLLRYPML